MSTELLTEGSLSKEVKYTGGRGISSPPAINMPLFAWVWSLLKGSPIHSGLINGTAPADGWLGV